MKTEFTTSELELRSTDEGPRLTGIILQEGRAATGGRAELFTLGALSWDASGDRCQDGTSRRGCVACDSHTTS